MAPRGDLIRVTIGRALPRGVRGPSSPSAPPSAGAEPACFIPPIDIYETPEGLVLEADLPGAAESGIAVQVEDNVLTIRAAVGDQAPEAAQPIHLEYRVGPYLRTFILSDEVDRERIRAELKNGVLRVVLPTSERGRARRIEVKEG